MVNGEQKEAKRQKNFDTYEELEVK